MLTYVHYNVTLGHMNDLTTIRIDAGQLVKARTEAGISQSEAARRVGIARQQLWNYEHGLFAVPSHVIARLCALYKIPISTLTTEPQIFLDG
jgi:transcriptional regulator with XRE-family HTH domain